MINEFINTVAAVMELESENVRFIKYDEGCYYFDAITYDEETHYRVFPIQIGLSVEYYQNYCKTWDESGMIDLNDITSIGGKGK